MRSYKKRASHRTYPIRLHSTCALFFLSFVCSFVHSDIALYYWEFRFLHFTSFTAAAAASVCRSCCECASVCARLIVMFCFHFISSPFRHIDAVLCAIVLYCYSPTLVSTVSVVARKENILLCRHSNAQAQHTVQLLLYSKHNTSEQEGENVQCVQRACWRFYVCIEEHTNAFELSKVNR